MVRFVLLGMLQNFAGVTRKSINFIGFEESLLFFLVGRADFHLNIILNQMICIQNVFSDLDYVHSSVEWFLAHFTYWARCL